MLLRLLAELAVDRPFLLLLAPRHLQRLAALREMLQSRGVEYQLLGDLRTGAERRHSLVIIDSLGELAEIYAVATYVFCGGSLVARHGHNVMEAAIWERPVCHGPSMADFRDAAQLLADAGAGFLVHDAAELAELIKGWRREPEAYRQACLRAGATARAQQGAAARQARLIAACLQERR